MKKVLPGFFALAIAILPTVALAAEAKVPPLPDQASDTAETERAEALTHNKNYTPPA